jgi:hypothetical protein
MDQLKLVLEHKFWILAGLAVLLPPIGWWAATDKIATDTIARNTKIAEAEKKIPNPTKVPNEKWIKGAKEIDSELVLSVVQSRERLFDHQKSEMKLPAIVQNALTKCKVKYRGDGGATQDFLAAREFFVGSYVEDWRSAVNEIKPYKMSTGEGLVLIPEEQERETAVITRHLEVEQWRQSLGFSADQMWSVQEDVWFLRSLMQAIARVNQGATEIGNARIKELSEITLRGGSTADLAARRSGKSTSTSSNAPAAAKTGGMQLNMGFGSRHGAAGSSFQSTYKPPKAFDPDDIFGDDGSKGDTIVDRKSKDAGGSEAVRWVDSGGTWFKRGFVLKLVMDEREIPTLLAELSESAFPVEIRHVEHSVHISTSASARSTSSSRPTTNPDGSEFTKEQQAQQQKIAESLRLAFNMHYLADVIIAGTMTIYSEPATSTSKIVAAAQPAPNQAAVVGSRKMGGAGDVKNALPGVGPAKPSGPVSKALATPAGTRTDPVKTSVPASPQPRGNKTNPGSPQDVGTSKPLGSGSQSTSK